MEMQKNLSMISIVSLKESIEKLKTSEKDSIAINALCEDYSNRLSSGSAEDELCESFIVELSKIANTDTAKEILNSLNESVKANEINIKIANCIHEMFKGSCMYVAPVFESAIVEYMLNKNEATRNDVRVTVSLFENAKPVKDLMGILAHEEYEEKAGRELVNASLKESFVKKPAKTYTESEVSAIVENRLSEAAKATPKAKKTIDDIESHIGLSTAISNITKSCGKNKKLCAFCESFIEKLNSGKAEELLYEEFISGASNWNYLSAVDTELSAINDRVDKYRQDIDLKKILRIMEQTGSYYLVPLIEDCVADYVNNKSMTTRAILKQRIEPFSHDPFVRDILSVINQDMSMANTVHLGESVEILNNAVHTEDVYSPLLYLNENECVFNVKGEFYKRNGSSITKISRKDVNTLDESFRNLCKLVNESNIDFSQANNAVSIYEGSDVAVISESEITINGKKVSTKDIDDLAHTAFMMNEDKGTFYSDIKTLNENFDNIAYLDFVKRVASNSNTGKSVDVFKIKNNIFVTTIDESANRTIFYRNVNPIQCRSYINEHMEINVAPLFEDVLPNQDSVKKNIEKKNREFENYIETLENKLEAFKEQKEDSADEATEDIDKAIDLITKEIEDAKNDYKKYQEESDKFLNGDEKDADDSLKNEVPDVNPEDIEDEPKDEKPEEKPEDDKKEGEDDEDKAPEETPEEMEKPIEDTEEDFEVMDMQELEPEYAQAAEFDSVLDTPAQGSSFNVVKVAYEKNVKSGESKPKGEVFVMIPSVNSNGDVHDEIRKISFYLTPERKPVINNDDMQLDLYYAIENAIKECPETAAINVEAPAPGEDAADVPAPFDADSDDIENLLKQEFGDDTINSMISAADGEIEEAPEEEAVAVAEVQPEAPAETEKKDEQIASAYPKTVGVYPEEIKPIKMNDFQKSLDDMSIKHSASEAGDGEMLMTIENKAQAQALMNHFAEWLNFTHENFYEFFPELKECFNECVSESVKIKGVEAVMESKKSLTNMITLPSEKVYCDMFGLKESDNSNIQIILENDKDIQEIYEKLYCAEKRGTELCEDAKDFMEKYSEKCGKLCESNNNYKVTVPYNGFLSQKLSSRGFIVESEGENMSVNVFADDTKKAKKIFESFYGDAQPVQVKDFFQYADEALNEGLKITVKDTNSDKTVEINVDGDVSVTSSADQPEKENEEAADFNSSFDNVTFDVKDSLAFSDKEEDADEKEDEKEEKTDENAEEDKAEETEKKDEKEGDEDEEKEEPKKKFKFRVKKSSDKESNESVKTASDVKPLNESAAPTVLDYVKVDGDKTGQIICQLANGNFIVNVGGHTFEKTRNQVSMINERPDTVECPYKFDANTLKGLFEQAVSCGVFMNQFRVTPSDCYVKYVDYVRAKDDEEIPLIIEGQATTAQKRYVKITEDMDSALDLGKYAPGCRVDAEGNCIENLLINTEDYFEYENTGGDAMPVRVLVTDDETGETHLVNLPGSCLMINPKN